MTKDKEYPITVLMSVYKTKEEYLREAIESILMQSFEKFEFIIIIDGIQDHVSSIINSYSDNRIKVYQNIHNIGLTKSLNIGLKIAKGKYIARMDSDDISEIVRLEKQYYYMEKNKDVGIVGSYAKRIGSRGFYGHHISRTENDLAMRLLFYNAGIVHPTAFIRRSFIEDYNLYYNEEYITSQDYALWVEAIKYGKIKTISEILLKRRQHSEQITKQNTGEYAGKIRFKKWTELGIVFDKGEQIYLRSIMPFYDNCDPDNYDLLFKKITDWNNKNLIFNKCYLSAEISMIWIYNAIRKIYYDHKMDILFNRRIIYILLPYNIFRLIQYYLLDNLIAYMCWWYYKLKRLFYK